jgi:predicted amidophosphoribosyltransferase
MQPYICFACGEKVEWDPFLCEDCRKKKKEFFKENKENMPNRKNILPYIDNEILKLQSIPFEQREARKFQVIAIFAIAKPLESSVDEYETVLAKIKEAVNTYTPPELPAEEKTVYEEPLSITAPEIMTEQMDKYCIACGKAFGDGGDLCPECRKKVKDFYDMQKAINARISEPTTQKPYTPPQSNPVTPNRISVAPSTAPPAQPISITVAQPYQSQSYQNPSYQSYQNQTPNSTLTNCSQCGSNRIVFDTQNVEKKRARVISIFISICFFITGIITIFFIMPLGIVCFLISLILPKRKTVNKIVGIATCQDCGNHWKT